MNSRPDPTEDEAIRVAVTGAAGMVCGSLIHYVAQGRMFGPSQRVTLFLLEVPVPAVQAKLEGVIMEMRDCNYELVEDIVGTADPNVAFKDIDVALLVGARPRGPGMERADLLAHNSKIFEEQGAVLDKVAKKSVKVCVVGNPANTNALIAAQFAPSIPRANFTALTRLDQNRAVSQIQTKSGCRGTDISNVYIWGNHSTTQVPDVNHAKIGTQAVREKLQADTWIDEEFIPIVQNRGKAIIDKIGGSSTASAANAICDHMHDWWYGTKTGRAVSMVVCSNGNSYGIPEGLMYSFPVTIDSEKNWTIVEGLTFDNNFREMLDKSSAELVDERKIALNI